jgi:hypothetical protein
MNFLASITVRTVLVQPPTLLYSVISPELTKTLLKIRKKGRISALSTSIKHLTGDSSNTRRQEKLIQISMEEIKQSVRTDDIHLYIVYFVTSPLLWPGNHSSLG